MPHPIKKQKKPKATPLDRALNRIYRLHDKSIDLNLDRVHRLLHDLGNPQDNIAPVIHIAGTNGKGSTLAYIQAILEQTGFSIHKHTSPHLIRFNERLILNGAEISDEDLLPLIKHVEKKNNKKPITFFEFCMGLNLHAFSQTPADVILLETGLGGRLDASNVVTSPLATLITKIGIDHIRFLGDDIKDIAREKAGIMKAGTPCFVGKQASDDIYDVFWEKAIAMDVPLYIYGTHWQTKRTDNGFDLILEDKTISLPLPNLIGDHQIENAGLAIASLYYLEKFDIAEQDYVQGIKSAKWPARMQHITEGALIELIPPTNQIWLDGGHNIDGTTAIAKILEQWHAEGIETHLIFGTLKNKDPVSVITPLLPHIKTIHAIGFDYPRARSAQETTDILKQSDITAHPHNSIEEALTTLAQTIAPSDRILICGSLYLAGRILVLNARTPLA